MKTIFSLFIAIFYASPLWASPVVKFKSEPCGQSQEAMYSSVLLFNDAQKAQYAVGQSQYVFNDKNYCHYVLDENLQWIAVELIAWEWNAPALFKLKQYTKAADEIDINVFEPTINTVIKTQAHLWGISAAPVRVVSTAKTTVVTKQSDRGTWTSMIEVSGSAIDQGWVGGILVENSKIIGFISNQFLEVTPGTSTRLEFWHRTSQVISYTPLIMRYHDLQEFVLSHIGGSVANDWASISVEDQKKQIDRIVSGDLEFTADCPDPLSGSTNGTYPIGGTDLVGIGGEGWGRPGCIITVRLATQPTIIHHGLLDQSNWYEEAKTLLKKADYLEIWYLYSVENNFDYLDRDLIYSLQKAFFEMKRSAFGPSKNFLTVAYLKGAVLPGVDSNLDTLRQKAQQVSADTKEIYLKHKDLSDQYTLSLLREIYFVSSVALSENYKDVSLTQLESLLDKTQYQFEWDFIEHMFLGNKPNLHNDLTDLKDMLSQL